MATTFLNPLDKAKITEKVNEVYEKAKKIFPALKDWKRPSWDTKIGGGRVAGLAHLQINHMSFHPELFIRNKQSFFDDTIPHEVAHLVAYKVYKDNGHGIGWQTTMRKLGYEPIRCHDYENSDLIRKVKLKRFEYKCGCKVYHIMKNDHEKIIGKKITMRCPKCKGFLSYQNRMVLINNR
jgi:SprT protein